MPRSTPQGVRAGLLLPPAVAAAVATATGAAVPVGAADWALAGTILVAALGQAEVTRRARGARHEPAPHVGTAVTSVWLIAAALAVHLALAVALVLVLCAYRVARDRRDLFDTVVDAGSSACALVAAHVVAHVVTPDGPSFGAGAAPRLPVSTTGVLAVVAAVLGYLLVSRLLAAAAAALRHREVVLGRAADLGVEVTLLATGAVVGTLAPGGFLVVLVAVPVVVMLHGASLTPRLENEASVDQKTGLATAASWQAHADRTFAAAVGERRPVGVLMVDLDHFKRLNDTYGHHAGDEFLAAVGACLRSQLRHSDLGGRFGGEEFTVLLPDTDVDATVTAAERIRAAISSLRVTTIDTHGRHAVITGVTASIGAATHPDHGTTAHDCLRIADHRVYQAKRRGRNTVVGR